MRNRDIYAVLKCPDNHSVAARQFSRQKESQTKGNKGRVKTFTLIYLQTFFLLVFDNSLAREGGGRYARLIGFTIWTRYVPGTWLSRVNKAHPQSIPRYSFHHWQHPNRKHCFEVVHQHDQY